MTNNQKIEHLVRYIFVSVGLPLNTIISMFLASKLDLSFIEPSYQIIILPALNLIVGIIPIGLLHGYCNLFTRIPFQKTLAATLSNSFVVISIISALLFISAMKIGAGGGFFLIFTVPLVVLSYLIEMGKAIAILMGGEKNLIIGALCSLGFILSLVIGIILFANIS